MLLLFRWLVRLTIGLMIGFVAAVVLAWYFAVRSLPDYDAQFALAGVQQPVEIVRTTENVPHILAATDHDAFFALGFAHAQDRLFQMVVLRRAAQGRLAEMFGERAYAADDLARRLGLWRNAQASVEAQDEPTQAALLAYADGVNAWVQQVNEGARGRGAPEFFLLPGDIAYWQPADSLAILKLVAAGASGQIRAEVMRARVSIAAPQRAGDLVGAEGEPPLPGYAALFGSGARFVVPPETPAPDWFDSLVGYVGVGLGATANAFAAAAERTAAGAPLLANDPHVALTAPSLWYLARMDLQAGSVIGGTIPGIPAILAGRNPGLAWGLTPAWVDDQDIVMEEVQPGAPDRYLGDGGWRDFSTRHEIIRVHGASDRRITLRETEAGPVIPPAQLGLAGVTPMGHVPALRWTGLSTADTTMTALVALMQSPDRAEAQRAARGIVAPAVEVTLADEDGIAQVLAGEIPRRAAEHPTAGRMPAPGRDPNVRWLDPVAPGDPLRATALLQGMVAATGAERAAGAGIALIPPPGGTASDGSDPQAALTTIPASSFEETNPAAGTGKGATRPPNLGYDRDDPLRLSRLSRLLAAREIHSRDSFIDAQLDTVSPTARALLPIVGAELWFTGDPAAPGTPERQRQEALALLAEWDGNMSEHLPEPLIYSAWMRHLQERLIHDELGPLAGELGGRLQPSFIDRVFRDTDGASAWCDVAQSAPVEDCATIARQAMDAALIDLTARFGPDVESWRWGDIHVARHEHPALGRMPVIGWVVSLVQSTSGDGSSIARAPTLGGGTNPWAAVGGAGYRGVYDLADPDSSVFVIATGQSGHPLSRHYDDQAERWRRGEYVAMSLDPTLARAGAVGVTVLTVQE
ncbi:penicillin acylase family protein [Paracoccus sp. MC1854]|uniref:penicillin acylase family protein n=1 Tax=Paracoccus sp. MC1854 TaxID=2760306 RepID=UPI0015FF2AAB|nr:penicillin acylase family protein [Paracoccus sp. MC1854]MBB1491351.1 penicillin acylase family protein [Paracoccus sp. MC1854]